MPRLSLAVAGSFLIVASTIAQSFAAHPMLERLEGYSIDELWTPTGARAEKVEVDGEPAIRWHLEPGSRAELQMKANHPLFGRLRYYDRIELEFKIIKGRLDTLELLAMGHVSGARQYKMHQYALAIQTTPAGQWQTRGFDLDRPNWFPWDDADGIKPQFCFGALAQEPGTVVELRRVRLVASPVAVKPFFELPITWPLKSVEADGSVAYTLKIPVLNHQGKTVSIRASVASEHKQFNVRLENEIVTLRNNQTGEFTVKAVMSKDAIAATSELYHELLRVRFAEQERLDEFVTFEMPLTRPLGPGLRRQIIVNEADLKFVRDRFAQGDKAMEDAVGLKKVLEEADRFVAIDLRHIPTGHLEGRMNYWPVVPDSKPPRRYVVGDSMPAIVDPDTGQQIMGTGLAGRVWKEYLGHSGRLPENLGLAYLFTGDEKYAAKAVELMELYAAQYPELPWSVAGEPKWGRGPAYLSSSRTAANSSYGGNFSMRWMMRLLGFIGDSPSLTPEKRQKIYEGFVLPYATELAKFPGGISNMTDITNHNLLVMGLVFDDSNLVRWALQSEPGLLSRLGDIDQEGFSSEGRPVNYHYAAMAEYLPGIAYLMNSGLKVPIVRENLLAALRMPYERATLWGFIPNSGDCGRGARVGNVSYADELLALFPENPFLLDIGRGTTLAAKVQRLKTERPVQKEGYKQFLETRPRLYREAGLAILRTGETPETQIMATLDYGRNPMHGHLDRGQITLSAFGKVFTHGTGTTYNAGSGGITRHDNHPLGKFCGAGSLGQNVVLVDMKNQSPCFGELVSWNEDPANQSAVARIGEVAPGVTHTRGLWLREGTVIIVDRLESQEEHLYDFAYHNFGVLALGQHWKAVPHSEPLGSTANYELIGDLARLSGSGAVQLNWDLTEQVVRNPKAKKAPETPPVKLALWQLPIEGSEVYTGMTGMGNPNTAVIPDAAPSLFTRVRGKTASFVTVLEPYKEAPVVTGIERVADKLIIQLGTRTLEVPLQ